MLLQFTNFVDFQGRLPAAALTFDKAYIWMAIYRK